MPAPDIRTVVVVARPGPGREHALALLSAAYPDSVGVEPGGPLPARLDAALVECDHGPGYAAEIARLKESGAAVLACVGDADDPEAAIAAGADDWIRPGVLDRDLVIRLRSMVSWRRDRDALLLQSRDLQTLLDLTRDFASALDLSELLHDLTRRLASELGVARCSIILAESLEEEGSARRRADGEGRPQSKDRGIVVAASDTAVRTGIALDLDRYPELREVMRTGRPLAVVDAPGHPLLEGEKEKIAKAGVAALAAFPLNVKGVVTGALLLRAGPERGPFTIREMHFGATVANAIGLALRNAKLVERLQQEFKEKEHAAAEYMDLFEHLLEGVIVLGPDGKALVLNIAGGAILGQDPKTVRGTPLIDFVVPEDRHELVELLAAAGRGQALREVDIAVRTRREKRALLSVAAGPLMGGEIVVSFRDVTAARHTEAELRHTKEFLEKLIDSSPDAIIAADRKGRLILFNEAAERICKYTAREALAGLNVMNLYPEGVAAQVMKQLRSERFGGAGKLEGVRKEILAKDGELVPVILSAVLLHEDGKEVASVGIFTDLRDRLRVEKKLAQTEEKLQATEKQAMIVELAGTAAHELNQPLTSVMGYAELVRRRLSPEDPNYRSIDIIFKEAERMAEIVRKIGKITRYETKAYVGKQRIVDLDKASEQEPPGTVVKE